MPKSKLTPQPESPAADPAETWRIALVSQRAKEQAARDELARLTDARPALLASGSDEEFAEIEEALRRANVAVERAVAVAGRIAESFAQASEEAAADRAAAAHEAALAASAEYERVVREEYAGNAAAVLATLAKLRNLYDRVDEHNVAAGTGHPRVNCEAFRADRDYGPTEDRKVIVEVFVRESVPNPSDPRGGSRQVETCLGEIYRHPRLPPGGFTRSREVVTPRMPVQRTNPGFLWDSVVLPGPTQATGFSSVEPVKA